MQIIQESKPANVPVVNNGLRVDGQNGWMSVYILELRNMWMQIPNNEATKILLNEIFCSNLKNDNNEVNLSRILSIIRARGIATNVPPNRE